MAMSVVKRNVDAGKKRREGVGEILLQGATSKVETYEML